VYLNVTAAIEMNLCKYHTSCSHHR